MEAITLRNVPLELRRAIAKEAEATGLSLNKTVIRLLEQAAGVGSEGRARGRYHDLDHLIGTWSDEEAVAFGKAVAEQRTVDPELWRQR